MITRNFKVNVRNNTSSSQQSIVFYKNDNNILLNIELKNFKFELSNKVKVDATIFNKKTGSKNIISIPQNQFNKNSVTLVIGYNGITINEVGTYKVQLCFYDENGNRISVPAFDIEVRDTIY